MAREILFCGKRTDNGKWIEGFYVRLFEKANGFYKAKHYIFDGNTKLGEERYCGHGNYEQDVKICKFEVIPETVGRYTGLTDKNDKRIFEGDILWHHNNFLDSEVVEKGVVFWDEKYCGWRRTSNGVFHNGIVDAYRLSPDCVYEVIGNIHDNPELLNGKES